ncbi:unnamed protein product [Paramecium pentaurelia]|uniref:Transmembrane protein n=1 Tax=Paramecium pentaurelia TaxID=43138 RepID=A0A8S1VVF4_9CILI|nr:unnamed protein product [Paramecium pentaurelia]
MQQVKYPNLENIQYSQPSSSNQDLQQQLVNKTNENIKFIPVLISPQENLQGQAQYQQYSQYQQHQVAPYYQNQNDYIVPLQNTNYSNLIKDKEFPGQKLFLCGILGIYILWSIIFVILLFPISMLFVDKRNGTQNPIYFILLILFSFTTILLAKLGIRKNNRNTLTSILILFGVILSYTCFYSAFLSTLASFSTQQFGWDFVIAIFLAASVIGNFIFNFILLIYLVFAEEKLKMIYPILIELIGILIFSIIYHPIFLFCILFMLPYSISLMSAFSQIIKGRFQLERNQVFAGAIASFYSQIVCCTD